MIPGSSIIFLIASVMGILISVYMIAATKKVEDADKTEFFYLMRAVWYCNFTFSLILILLWGKSTLEKILQ